MREKLRDKKWYPYTVAACSAVLLYVVLTNISPIMNGIKVFGGFFSSLFLGAVIAYLMNPLAKLFKRILFGKLKNEKLGWMLSVAFAVIVVLLAILFLLGTLIPQLVESVTMLINNMDGYILSLETLIQKIGVTDLVNLDDLVDSSGDLMNQLLTVLKDNLANILNASVAAGKGIAKMVIALIVSIYLLASKDAVKTGSKRLLRALLPEKRYQNVSVFLRRCDSILIQYIVYSLLDSLIVGVVNAIFMTIMGMQYVGLVSLVVAVTNLIPTFGPIIGYVVGGFVLLLVNPMHALIFIVFSLILQLLDGYVIKPKLFGNSLGVSGLLILAAVLVCGSMFGIIGMLLAIPLAAILDFSYKEALLPALERRRESRAVPPDSVSDNGHLPEDSEMK